MRGSGGSVTDHEYPTRLAHDHCDSTHNALNCDGGRWTAIPLGTETVITAGSKDELNRLLMTDAQTRVDRAGYWIETASGPPYFVDTSDPRRRGMRS
jgi:hypothetical protein